MAKKRTAQKQVKSASKKPVTKRSSVGVKKDLKPKRKASAKNNSTPKKKISKKNSSSKNANTDSTNNSNLVLKTEDLNLLNSRKGVKALLRKKEVDLETILKELRYEDELRKLQIELIRLQRDVQLNQRRVAVIFEGRDAAGKGGAIRRFMEHLNPRTARVVALPKPSDVEKGQWYFQRYVKTLPNPGEICFFDRSWYNRAVVEPVMNFCSQDQYYTFMRQVPEFEHMLYEDNIELIKFWFSISKDEQESRFFRRRTNPLKQWKISPVDERAQEHWDLYTYYKEEMFSKTHTSYSPWIIVKANSKKRARLESMRYVLSSLSYEGKGKTDVRLHPNPNTVIRFHRSAKKID